MAYDNNLFFTCSLIEFMGRQRKLRRNAVVTALGGKALQRIYDYADVLHCEPIAKVADETIASSGMGIGDFDNVTVCRYTAPGYWDIGKVYSRLIDDVAPKGDPSLLIETLKEVYGSWISDSISNYNSDFFYQPRDYIRECYREGRVL